MATPSGSQKRKTPSSSLLRTPVPVNLSRSSSAVGASSLGRKRSRLATAGSSTPTAAALLLKQREIEVLKRQLLAAKTNEKQWRLKFEASQAEEQREELKEALGVDRLKGATAYLYKQEVKLKKQLEEQEEKLLDTELSYRARIRELEEANAKLLESVHSVKSELQVTRDALQDVQHSAQMEKNNLNSEINALREQTELDTDSLRALRAQAELATELQAELDALRASSSGSVEADSNDDPSSASSQQSDLIRSLRARCVAAAQQEAELRKCKAELKRLRLAQTTWAVLEEEVKGLRPQAARASKLMERIVDLSAQVKTLRTEQVQWHALGRNLIAVSRDDEVPRPAGSSVDVTLAHEALATLQREREQQLRKIGELQVAATRASSGQADAEERASQLAIDAKNAQSQLDAARQELTVVTKKWKYAVKHRDAIQGILASYEEDGDNHDSQLAKRITVLEQALKDAEAINEKGGNSGLAHRVKALSDENASLKKLLDRAERDAGRLEAQMRRGDFNPRTTKVLHMTANPHSLAVAAHKEKAATEVRTLSLANQQLKKEVVRLRGLASAAPSSPSASSSSQASSAPMLLTDSETKLKISELEAENKRLKNDIQEVEISKDRLGKAVKAHIDQYRAACTELTGFNIKMEPKLFRLRPRYAQKSEVLLFRRGKDDDLKMVRTPFSDSINPGTMEYLIRHGSIPAFLAQVTLDLFAETTVAI